MNQREADRVLEDAEVVPVFQGPLLDMKSMRDRCLAEDIPVLLVAPPGKG
jgi:hypothetical protein